MVWIGRLSRRLRALVRKEEIEREMDEEMRFHLEMEAEELARAEVLSPEDAWRQARIAFGGVERFKEEGRESRGVRWIEDAATDARYAVRMLAKTPGFTAVVVLTLALGIGANSAIFSVANGVLLRPLEYSDPNRLAYVYSEVPAWGSGPFGLSPSEYRELQDLARSFSDVGAWRLGSVNVSGLESPVRVTAASATAELFVTLGVAPHLGRAFTRDEDLAGELVVLLSNRLWRSAFGRDSAIVGRQIEVDGRARTIIGVMPEGFDVDEAGVDVWLPARLPVNPRTSGSHFLSVAARLAPGITLEEARSEMDLLLAGWGELKPSWHAPNDSTHRLGLERLHEHMVGDARAALLILLGTVALVLLSACANVMNLLLARAERRHREIALRAAMGAGRRRLVRQFLTEGIVLASIGGVAGLLLGRWGLGVVLATSPGSVPRADAIGLDLAVLLFTLALTALSSVLFGLAPLSYLKKGAMSAGLRDGGVQSTSEAGRTQVRRALVISQVALATVLLIGSGLMVRSLDSLLAVDPGFEARGVLAFEISLPVARYPEGHDRAAFLGRLARGLEAIPGVTHAAATNSLPLVQNGNPVGIEFEGGTRAPGEPAPSIDYVQVVTSDYFETMGIRIVAGRTFEDGDDARATPVVVINETVARTFYAREDPVGRRVRLAWGNAPWLTIVGVAEDVKQTGLAAETGPEMYFPYPQAVLLGFAPRSVDVAVRALLPPLSLADEARRAVHALDPSLPVAHLRTMEAVLTGAVDRPRFLALLFGIFAGIGLALAAVGTYGVLSYIVAARRGEIGIRMALGAPAGRVLEMVLRDGLFMAGVGLALGVVAALGGTRLLSALLFGISSTDSTTYVAAIAVLAAVVLAACWVPARRATRVDPMVALRSD